MRTNKTTWQSCMVHALQINHSKHVYTHQQDHVTELYGTRTTN